MPLTAEQFNEMDPAEKARIAKMLSGQSPSIPGLPDFQAPKNVWQGLGNIVKNQRQIIGERLGTRESPTDLAARYRINSTVQAENRRRQLAQALLAMGYPPNIIQNMSQSALEDLAKSAQGQVKQNVYGDTVQTGILNGAQSVLSTAPSNVREYNFAQSQLPSPQRSESFEDYEKRTTHRKGQNVPSVIQQYEYLKQMDPEHFASLDPQGKRDLYFKILRQDPVTAGLIAGAQHTAGLGGVSLTPAQQDADKLFAADWTAYNSLGGSVAANASIDELNEIIKTLMENDNITGRTIAMSPRELRSDISIDTQDRIEKIITLDLRQTLGAAFTEQESKNFIDRSFNVMLPERVNAARLRRVRSNMRRVHKAKAAAGRYYQKHGTIKGMPFGEPTIEEIENGIYKESDYIGLNNDELISIIRSPNVADQEWDIINTILDDRGYNQ